MASDLPDYLRACHRVTLHLPQGCGTNGLFLQHCQQAIMTSR